MAYFGQGDGWHTSVEGVGGRPWPRGWVALWHISVEGVGGRPRLRGWVADLGLGVGGIPRSRGVVAGLGRVHYPICG